MRRQSTIDSWIMGWSIDPAQLGLIMHQNSHASSLLLALAISINLQHVALVLFGKSVWCYCIIIKKQKGFCGNLFLLFCTSGQLVMNKTASPSGHIKKWTVNVMNRSRLKLLTQQTKLAWNIYLVGTKLAFVLASDPFLGPCSAHTQWALQSNIWIFSVDNDAREKFRNGKFEL